MDSIAEISRGASHQTSAGTTTFTPLHANEIPSSSDATIELRHFSLNRQSSQSYKTTRTSWDAPVKQDDEISSEGQENTTGVHTRYSQYNLEEENGSIGISNFTESTNIPRRLETLDVAALIFNKMVGSGIFTTPGLVLSLTKSKALALGLWAVGGVYTGLW